MTESDDTLEIPEEELSEEEKELKKLTESFYKIRLTDLPPVEQCVPAGYKLFTKRGKDKTSTFLSRSATFISIEIFEVSGVVECLHCLSNYALVYIISDQDGKAYNVKIPVVQAYHNINMKTYKGRCQKIWIEEDNKPSQSFHQVR